VLQLTLNPNSDKQREQTLYIIVSFIRFAVLIAAACWTGRLPNDSQKSFVGSSVCRRGVVATASVSNAFRNVYTFAVVACCSTTRLGGN
jgi:hypothetical protein